MAWLNAAPASIDRPTRAWRLDRGAVFLVLCGIAFWGAVAWAGYSLLA